MEPYPAGYHARAMRHLAPTLTLTLLLAACPPPEDSATPSDCTRIDDTVGSIVHVCWEQPSDGTVNLHYRVVGEDWRPTIGAQLEAGPRELPLLGLPFGAEVEYYATITQTGETVAEGTITTDPLPADMPVPVLLEAHEDLWDPGAPYLLASIDRPDDVGTPEGSWAIVLDRQGRVVWALESPPQRLCMHPRISADGAAVLMDLNSHFGAFDRGAASQVQRVGLDGAVQQTWDTPGLHHPFTDQPDGSMAWGAWGEGLETLEIIDPDGSQRTLWSCDDFHTGQGHDGTPCSSNTLSWSPARDSFLFSFYTTHTMVEIDADGGTVGWFGQLDGGWSFEPEESEFVWQHGGHVTEAGTLLVSMRRDALAEETVAREYLIHDDTQTLEQIWSYGNGEGLYAPELGEALRLPGGNTLLNYGTGTRLREVTPDGAVAWDLRFEGASLLGRSEPMENLYALWPR